MLRTFSLVAILGIAGAFCASPIAAQEFRTLDGSGNNLADPTMGSSGMPLVRLVPSDYADGVSAPAGATRPNPRTVSNIVCAQTSSTPNSAGASDFLWQWGQFLDHDLDLTLTDDGNPLAALPIAVPAGDPFFDPLATGTATIAFTRSAFVPGSVPRQQANVLTAWIDASNVYGSDPARAQALRTLDGTGRLRTSPGDLLPKNDIGLANGQPQGADPTRFFLAGDVRANEQIALTAIHTLFLREHNRLADEIATASPGLTDDEIYYRARRLVGAQMQRITYEEFLPTLLGPGALPPYAGYDSSVDTGIRNIFSTACFRVGHTLLSPTLLRLGEAGTIPEGNIPLAAAFFAPEAIILDGGIDPILRGLAAQPAQEIDPQVIGAVRNFLFGPPGAGGLDLASLNIQRGRDHGLPGYDATRVALGLAGRTSFAEITSDPERQAALALAYGDVASIDLWVGALAEDHLPGAMVGELLHTVFVEQFAALRDGDRFWYQIDLTPAELAEIESTTLADVIRRNTAIDALPDDVFHVASPDFVRGDCNADGGHDIADAITALQFLFAQGSTGGCAAACDSNADAAIDIADAIHTVSTLFEGGAPPPLPHPTCGPDPAGPGGDALPCFGFAACP